MYTLTLESKNPEIFFKLELNNLEDIYKECNQTENIEKYNMREILDKIEFGINILEPGKTDEDFIFKYANSIFWDYFKPGMHEYLIGRQFSDVMPELNNLNMNKVSFKTIYLGNQVMDSILKLYHDEDLIKAWSQKKLNYQNQLIIIFEDKTNYHIEKLKQKKIFEEASFPKLQIDNNLKILKVNKAFKKSIGYSADDLNNLNLDDLIIDYKTKTKSTNFKNNLNLLFNKKEKAVTSEIGLCTVDSKCHYFESYSRLISPNLIQIGFHDLTELKETKQNELNIDNYFKNLQKVKKTAVSLSLTNEIKWGSEIYELFEIPEDKIPDLNNDFIYDYLLPSEELKIKEAMNNLTDDNATKCIYKARTYKGNIKYFKVIFQISYENGEKGRLGFTEDVTDDYIFKQEAFRLQDNFKFIEESSQIGIAEYNQGKYYFTSQIYNILGVKKEDYPDSIDIVHEHIIPEDLNKWENALNITPEHDMHDVTYRVKTENNQIKYIYCNNKGIFNNNGEIVKVLGFLMDVTDEILIKKSATELQNNLEHIQKNSKIVIATFTNGKYKYTNEIYNILEIKQKDFPNNVDLIYKFAVPQDQEKIVKEFRNLTPSKPNLHLILQMKTSTGKIKYIEDFIVAEFDENGDLIKRIGFMHEITSLIEKENKLEELSEERKILLQEIHDRVKNNLQLILSFINVDLHYNSDNPNYVINQTQNRIKTMALTHEEVYQSDSVGKVNLKNLLTKILNHVFIHHTSNNLNFYLDIDDVELDINRCIPLGLLTNEIVLNTLKYGFPNNEPGNIYGKLKLKDGIIDFKLWDDGVGVVNPVEVFNSNTLGFVIIKHLASQLKAEVNVLTNIDGFGLEFIFKK